MRRAWTFLAGAVAISMVSAQEVSAGVPAAEAWRAIGKSGMVCGQVVDSDWASKTPNAPTYLYLDRPRPEQVFTVVIPYARREVFGDSPEKSFRGKRVCVTGKVESDVAAKAGHKARMVVESDDQIAVE